MSDHTSVTTEGSGNTNPSPPIFRGRSFLFTLNEVDKWERLSTILHGLKSCVYCVAAKEIAPSTGHEHIHAYAHFKDVYRLSQKIMALKAHIDVCKGSPQQVIKYVKKDGNIIEEWGDEPHQGRQYTVKELMEMSTPDELEWRQLRAWEAARSLPKKVKKSDWRKDVKVYYIEGPSGVGKSTKAEEIADDEFDEVKHVNGFWNGVTDGEGCCIYDDFRDSHMPASEFINFIDYRSHNLNIKGGCRRNGYTKIIITSVQSLDDIYGNVTGEPREQWMRRIERVVLEKDYDL